MRREEGESDPEDDPNDIEVVENYGAYDPQEQWDHKWLNMIEQINAVLLKSWHDITS